MESKAFGFFSRRNAILGKLFFKLCYPYALFTMFSPPYQKEGLFYCQFLCQKKWPTPSFNVGGGSPPAFFHSHNLGTLLNPLPFQGSLRFSHVFWSQKRWSQTGKCFPSLDGLAIVIWNSLKPRTWSSYLCHCLTFPVKFCSLSFYSFLWLHWAFREAPVEEKTESHRAPEILHRQFSSIATEAISGHGEAVRFFLHASRESAHNIRRKWFLGDYDKWFRVHSGWHSLISSSFEWNVHLVAATQWCETAGPQSLRPPPSTVSGDKEPLDKVQ